MTRQSKLLILMVAFCFLATSGILALQKSDETVTCPISGDEIKKSEAKGSCELDGKTYYFCCENCKEAFVKNPEKYTQEKEHEGHMHGEDLHKGHEHAEDKDNDTLKDPVGKDRTATGHGTMAGKDTAAALAKSGRLKGQSGR